MLDAALCGALWLRERREAAAPPRDRKAQSEEEEQRALLERDDFRDMRRMMWGVSSVNVRSLNQDPQDGES